MKQSLFIPMDSQDFEINVISDNMRAGGNGKPHQNILEEFPHIEKLFRLHRHDVFELLVFLGGQCEFFCDGKTYSLREGDIVVIPPYAVHQASVKDFHNYKRIIISIGEQLMNEFITCSPLLQTEQVQQQLEHANVLHLHKKSFAETIKILYEVNEKTNMAQESIAFSKHYLLFQALQIIFDPASSMSNLDHIHKQDPRFVAILEYIEEHLSEPDLSLEHIAKTFHLNKYYFSHYFKKNMNFPFYRYVSLKRLSVALTMIKSNEGSMEEIALACGFPDYSSFYRLFKKEYKLSPKKLQKKFS